MINFYIFAKRFFLKPELPGAGVVSITKNKFGFAAMAFCSRFIWITNSSDHRSV